MFTDVVWVVLQLRVVLEPELILVGRAVSTMLGAGLPEEVGVIWDLPPPHPIATIRVEHTKKMMEKRSTADINRSNTGKIDFAKEISR
jgi:hypothetical protein